MKNTKIMREAKSGRFVLTSKRGEKISAVEGLHLSERMSHVVRDASGKFLTSDERRSLIKETLRKR
ncbi:hypothetical protein [Mesorhizobium sp. CAU 1732]|uniref:hypothetical protein n=1 Tax=Mesorhizobium sp. CAU 1732 TaxID=3140358 RepID=UPI003260691C